MNSSLYIGATGMKGLSEGMQVTSNNLANISTIGYKQQNILFSDVMYQTQASMGDWWNAQDDSRVAIGQVGMGLQVETIRTCYNQGPIESTNLMTDLAINGKGFFQVTDGDNTYYTRAGDFKTDADGVWRTQAGMALMGYPLDAQGQRGDLAPVQVDMTNILAPKATTSLTMTMNLNDRDDHCTDEANPYFSLLASYDASKGTPLDSSQYGVAQQMTLYDAEGNPRSVTAYFDAAPGNGSSRFMEFVLADNNFSRVDEEGNPVALEAGDGLLMSGVLEFDAAGNLVNVAAFTPAEAGSKDLSAWTVAEKVNGNPSFMLDGNPVNINFGLSSDGEWQNAPASAAEIGLTAGNLPGLGEELAKSEFPTTAFNSSAFTNSFKQDGYAEGYISNLNITSDGKIVGTYSNGQSMDLWQIPVARFTSEDGLRREGGNLFSATEESGQMELGEAGTENYGQILAYNIEGSNVDMAQEMVNMILTQRGFQSNSKVVTTADMLLQKAMELKR